MSEEITTTEPIPQVNANMSAEEILDVLETVTVDTAQAGKALDRLCERFRVNGPITIADLRDLILAGRYTRVAGMRDLIRGFCVEINRIALQAIQCNEEDIAYLKKQGPRKYALEFYKMRECNVSFLKVINESIRHMMQNEGTLASLPEQERNEMPTAASFAPGQKVTPPSSGTVVVAQNAHFHEAAKPKEQEKPT